MQLYGWYQNGEKVCDPESVTPEQWRYILTLKTETALKKEFQYIGLKHHLKKKEKVRAAELAMDGPCPQ